MSKKRDQFLRIEARLASSLAGDPPQLDAVLEHIAHRLNGTLRPLTRTDRLPDEVVHIPMVRRYCGDWLVAKCSSPILLAANGARDTHEYVGKRLAVEHAELLTEKQRKVVATGNAIYKSYRLPVKVSAADSVVWFAQASRRAVKQMLRYAPALGQDTAHGYGRVASWSVDEIEHDWSWWVQTERGAVLMRALPWCKDLPDDLIGYVRDFGAVAPPYWHPDRYCERVIPC